MRTVPADGGPPPFEELAERAETNDALLVVGGRRRSPRTAVPGATITRRDGSRIPVGWLPDVGATRLARFASAAAGVHARTGRPAVAVLAQWHPQYLRLAHRVQVHLTRNGSDVPTFMWTSDAVLRDDMLRGLGSGLGAAFYVGHGRPIGWVGYRGLRSAHLERVEGEPLGVLFSLCCVTASRRRTGLSFAEAVPLAGVAAGVLAAVRDTVHTENARLAVRLSAAVVRGVRDLGGLVGDAIEPSPDALRHYRILGDPLAPIASHASALGAARAVPRFV